MSRKSVSNALARARERGLLMQTEPGRAGGRLTAKAEKLLEEKEQENRGTR